MNEVEVLSGETEALVPALRFPLLRSVPVAAKLTDPRLYVRKNPDSPQAAAFRVLRHRIDTWAQGAQVRLALVAPRSCGGATTAAANLALALSEGGSPVCLLEGNFRRPALAEVLGFVPPVCLSEQLMAHRLSQGGFVAAEVAPDLHVIANGPHSGRRPLADHRTLGMLVEAARQQGYPHIVVDGSHVLDSADANLVEGLVDLMILVARSGQTTAEDLQRAADQLGRSKLLGVVLLE